MSTTKIVFASFTMAVAMFIVTVVLVLFAGGPPLVEKLASYSELVVISLTALCVPIVKRHLR